jgi:hypothetical protein
LTVETTTGPNGRPLRPQKQADLLNSLALTIAQTCRVTNLGETKVRELIKAGRLQTANVDRRVLVTMPSVKALLGL